MGARVDSHGVLHEPFALLPLGSLVMAGAAGLEAADRLKRTAGE